MWKNIFILPLCLVFCESFIHMKQNIHKITPFHISNTLSFKPEITKNKISLNIPPITKVHDTYYMLHLSSSNELQKNSNLTYLPPPPPSRIHKQTPHKLPPPSSNKNKTTSFQDIMNDTTTLINIIPKIGIPLNIIGYFYTTIDKHHSIWTWQIFTLQFLIGFYTYGKDKLYDAYEYKKLIKTSNNPCFVNELYGNKKIQLFNTILQNEEFYKDIFKNTFYLIFTLLLWKEDNTNIFNIAECLFVYEFIKNIPFFLSLKIILSIMLFVSMIQLHLLPILPFVYILELTEKYTEWKKINGFLKPVIVSGFWTLSSFILPNVLIENNWNVLLEPVTYLSPFLAMYSLSSLADIKDIEEDRHNGVNTMAVTWGKYPTAGFNLLILYLSFIINEDFMTLIMDKHYLINAITSLLPCIDNIAYYVLHINQELIHFVTKAEWLPTEIKEQMILFFIKMVQNGDNTGTVILQMYYEIIKHLLHEN